MSKARDNAKGAGKYLDAETWDAMKAAGFTEEELQTDQPFGPIVFSYTRAQAIEDGVLVDVSEVARTMGFRIPVALTAGVYAAIENRGPAGQVPPEGKTVPTEVSIRWLLERLRLEIAMGMRDTDRLDFRHANTAMWSLCGPGDDAEPVLTVMLEGED